MSDSQLAIDHSSIKFLGVTIDDRLSFNEHVRDLAKRISMSTALFCRVKTLILFNIIYLI